MSGDPVLHGRAAPQATLDEALTGALAGKGRLVVVSGEAGIGKSALVAEAARSAEARGAKVTWGRAWEFADAPPHFPVWPCLRTLGIDPARVGHDAFHLWEEVVAGLARATQNETLVWILEDLHAADLGTLDLLTFLAPPLRAMRALVIATVRANDPRVGERVLSRLARMARDGIDVRLGPLSAEDVAAVAGEASGRVVSEKTAHRLVELTGGNPLFVVECARALKTAGGLESIVASLPATVRQVVADRVALLPEHTRESLAAGAVLGREFSAASVARMQETLPARTIDTLLHALRSGLVTETKPGHFLFSHGLVRDAIDDMLEADLRARLHRRADEALAVHGDTADVLVERARHALAALRIGGGEERALALAEKARALLEREQAFDRAFELESRVEEARAAGLLPPATIAEKMYFARIARAAGRSDVMRRTCEEIFSAARATHDAPAFARAALLHASDVRPGVVDRSQVTFLEEARAMLGEGEPLLACRVLGRLATALQPHPDQAMLIAMSDEAVRLARATNDDSAIMDVLEQARWAQYSAPLPKRIALGTELLDRALAANDMPRALTARLALAFHRLEEGDVAGFEREAHGMLVLSAEMGHPRDRWRALLLASTRAIVAGHFAESERYVTEVRQLAALVDDRAFPLAIELHESFRRRMMRHDDLLADALAALSEPLSVMVQGAIYEAAIRGMSWARAGDAERAKKALADIGAVPPEFFGEPLRGATVGEIVAIAGSDAERRRFRDFLAQHAATEHIGGEVSYAYDGTVGRVVGLLDAALGDLVSGEARLREAHALAKARGHRPLVAQIASELSALLARAGRADDARAFADESARIARELGMTGLVKDAAPHAVVAAPVAMAKTEKGWVVRRGDQTVSIKPSRGVELLARLVERAGEEIHVLALASDEGGSLHDEGAGDVVDDRSLRTYRARLTEIDEDLASAEANADAGRVEKLRHEKEALLAEISRAVGLGGRKRVAASASERARVNVQRRLKDAIARIAEADAGLGRFFEGAVKTGTFCCFRP